MIDTRFAADEHWPGYTAAVGGQQPLHSVLTGKRILIVEDECLIASDIAAHLEELGAIPVIAATEEAALASLFSLHIHAAVVDVDLQGSKSFRVAESLQEQGTLFVFVTACDRGLIPERHRTAAHLDKPAMPQELVDTLGELLK